MNYKNYNGRLARLEAQLTPPAPDPAPGPMTEAEWQDFIFSWLRCGALIVNPESRRFEVYHLGHKDWRETCSLLAGALNEWRDETGAVLIALTGPEITEALAFIEQGYFTMTYSNQAGYDIVFYNFRPSEQVNRPAYDSTRKVGAAIELYHHQMGQPQPATIEQVEQLLVEWQQVINEKPF